MILFRWVLESYSTSNGNLNGRANFSSVTYEMSGTFTCTATKLDGSTVTKSIAITLSCGKLI